MKYEFGRASERLWHFLARHTPRQLTYWCAVVLMAHASTGKWGHEVTPEITISDALKRWNE